MNAQEKNAKIPASVAQQFECLRYDREAIHWPHRVEIAKGLGTAIEAGITPDLAALLDLLAHDPKHEVRHAIANHLGLLPDEYFEPLSGALADDNNTYVVHAAKRALAERAKIRKASAKQKLGIDQISQQLKTIEDRHGATVARAAWRLAERYSELLVGSMVHDLRSILTHLRANTSTLAADATRVGAPPKIAKRVKEDIDFLERTVQDMERFTQSLSSSKSPHKLVELVQAAREQAETVVRNDDAVDVGRIQVNIQVPPWITLHVAPHLLVPALTNIIKNAYEAFAQAPSDGTAPTIHIIATADDVWADLQISDNGMGFAPEEAAALKPFTPGRRNKTKRNSTGYGLPNAMRNIAAHGGTVNIESKMNRGTTVSIRLSLPTEDALKVGGAL